MIITATVVLGVQPISTAPKDGTEILAWHLEGKTWHQVIWQKDRDLFGMRWNSEYCQGQYAFSHWMPLSEDPNKIMTNDEMFDMVIMCTQAMSKY